MIQFLSDNIDQLDLALDQLAISDRNYDRFAFMLVDNVVELTLHRFIQDKASENELWSNVNKLLYDPKVIEKALGQNFENKVKASHILGLINKPICDSILYLHSFRNTSYHRGMRHEGILHSLAIFYFKNACEVLKAYKPRTWSWSSLDQISYRARKYIGFEKAHDDIGSYYNAYCRLEEVVASMEFDLVNDLSDNMNLIIEDINDAIDFLSKNGPSKKSRKSVVIDAQVWAFAFTDEARKFSKKNECQAKNIASYVEWLTKNYNWPFKTDPINNWRKRLNSLSNEQDLHMALKRYCDFMKQSEEFRSNIIEAAEQLDGYIQHQIDTARGK